MCLFQQISFLFRNVQGICSEEIVVALVRHYQKSTTKFKFPFSFHEVWLADNDISMAVQNIETMGTTNGKDTK